MTEKYRQFITLIRKQVKKHWILHNAKGFAENVSEKTQSKFSNGQNIIVQQYKSLTKRLNDQTNIIQDLNAKPIEPTVPLPKRIVKWWTWYRQLTGLDAVEAAKQQVNILQDKLFEYQNTRRSLNKELIDISSTLQRVYGNMVQTNRDDPKYVDLTIQENKNLQDQKKIKTTLVLLEKEEKEQFTQLATAIKEYHDTQNINAQKYKYLSIIASILVAMVSLIGSIILNNKKVLDVKHTIYEAQGKNESLIHINTNQLSDLHKKFHSLEKIVSQNFRNKENNTNKEKEINKHNNNSSNIFTTSAKYVAHTVILGGSYTAKGIYACGSYIAKIFTG